MKYKVGDIVHIKSWERMVSEFGVDSDGDISMGDLACVLPMKDFCGKDQEIDSVSRCGYHIKNDDDHWIWTDDMIAGLAPIDEDLPTSAESDRYIIHRDLCMGLNELYIRKNQDYGNSFGEGFREYGLMMPIIRLEDKFKRFKQLATSGEQNVKDESIEDTLLDLANYALMTVTEMRMQKYDR